MHSNRDPLAYYAILGVNPSASPDEIRKAFKASALELHPDRNRSPKATVEFQLLNRAYHVLYDARSRKQYDPNYGEQPGGPKPAKPSSPREWNPDFTLRQTSDGWVITRSGRSKPPRTALAVGMGILVSVVLILSFIAASQPDIPVAPRISTTPLPPEPTLPLIPPIPLPPTGLLRANWRTQATNELAPLKITAGRENRYLKLVNLNMLHNVEAAAVFFIREGETLSTRLPLGVYELHSASGGTWYGEQHLFGPLTTYTRADARLAFRKEVSEDGYRLMGHQIELFSQIGGNLHEAPISPAEF